MLLLPRRRLLSGAAALALLPRLTRAQDVVIRHKSAAAPSSLLTGLTAYWPMNETGNNNRVDSVGGLVLAPTGTMSHDTGKKSNAAKFSGTSYLSTASNAALNFSGAFTIAFWLYQPTLTDSYPVAKAASGFGSYAYIVSHLIPNTRFYINSGLRASGTAVMSSVTWYLVVAVYTGSAAAIYLNNTLDVSTAYSSNGGTSTDSLTIGAGPAGASPVGANTLIDELGFWSRALTSDERTALYNGGAGVTYPFS
jgi:Concanavalin A-like lectin/glucanases superfamily